MDDIPKFLKSGEPIIEKLKSVKTAAVLNEKLHITSVVLSTMFSLGVWIAIFKDREQAIDWLLSESRRPRWLPTGSA